MMNLSWYALHGAMHYAGPGLTFAKIEVHEHPVIEKLFAARITYANGYQTDLIIRVDHTPGLRPYAQQENIEEVTFKSWPPDVIDRWMDSEVRHAGR